MDFNTKNEAKIRFSMRFLINSLVILALCLLLATFVFKVDFTTPYQYYSENILQNKVRNNEETVEIPLEDLMRAPVSIKQDNEQLIKKIRSKYLDPPSNEEYNLRDKNNDNPSMGQSEKILKILGKKRDGFFIECGALDGETRSNTLVFEKVYGWSGILIEGDPKNYNLVVQKRRKAWTVPACLSAFPYPNIVMFKQHFNVGRISNIDVSENRHRTGYAEVQCLPIYSILLAVNRTKVDYFSLDVEGHELAVLKTIPWDKVKISTLSVEYIHDPEGKDALKDYMTQQGYKIHSMVTHPLGLANDFIFYHPDLVTE